MTQTTPSDTEERRDAASSTAADPASRKAAAGAAPGGTAAASKPARAKRRAEPPEIDLDDADLFINRELSWLRFNERVLEEALDESNPLLERVFFLSIFASNLDEFFMVRVSGLRRQLAMGVVESPPDGMSPARQLSAIRKQLLPLLRRSTTCWEEDLAPKLDAEGVHLLAYDQLRKKQRRLLRRHFEREVFPVLTPLAFDPGHPFPHISNLSVNLAVVIDDPGHGERFARLKVPQTIPRLLRIPDEEKAEAFERLGIDDDVGSSNFVWLEEVIAANLDLLFPGHEVKAAYPFRVTRDADFEIEEDEAADLLTAMTEVVGQRHFGFAVRLEIDEAMPEHIRKILVENLELAPYQVFSSPGPLGRADLKEISGVDRPDLKFPPFQPVLRPQSQDAGLFKSLRGRNVVLYHPYDSFTTVVNLVREAAKDPDVLAIKQTLYRVGPSSPIVAALMEARQNGKQVGVLVELKARFDEENNIVWAQALEKVGVHVVYGVMGLKTHAKILLVVRRESDGIRRYAHLGTGNYNPITARSYTDLGYFTTDPEICDDLSDLFNSLTGYSRKTGYRKLLVAPGAMRAEILRRIEREIDRHRAQGDGYLAFKMNALVDKRCIQALYRASRAGVKVDLQVRGICCLRPEVPGVSENVRVTSIVGRFLEHPRMYYFRNGGDDELLMGSADLMPRNLDNRVETLFPLEDPALRRAVRDDVLFLHLRDNVKARRLKADGTYERVRPQAGEEPLDSQAHLLEHGGGWRTES